jgi:hypothetical protein
VRTETDSGALSLALRAKKGHLQTTMTYIFRCILLWSLLVERGKLALIDDPSVPMLRIFAAGYELNWQGHGLEIWGELPWTIRVSDILVQEGLRKPT